MVLIETLWNVKRDVQDVINVMVDVLIETLWNVKIEAESVLYGHTVY